MQPDQRQHVLDSLNQILADGRYRNLNELYGNIILTRVSEAPTPECTILSLLLRQVHHLLQKWDEFSGAYLNAVVSRMDAVTKAEAELLGPARKCNPGQFNSVVGDFFAEMCAVGKLSTFAYSHFEPIPPAATKTPDYRCIANSRPGCLEFKNIRAPQTILDTFSDLLPAHLQANPLLRSKRIVLTYYWDNTVTDEQREEIDTFLTTLDLSKPHHDLKLSGEVHVKVGIVEGDGSVMMTRGISIGDSTFVEEDKLMKKVDTVVEKAVLQLRQFDCEERVLAINIMTADMMLP